MTPAGANRTPVGRIRVTREGEIFYDGARTTLEALRTSLVGLRARRGVVWYYREAGGSGAPAAAMDVVRLVVEHRLPISMSRTPDFSDVVQADGRVVPRADPPTLG